MKPYNIYNNLSLDVTCLDISIEIRKFYSNIYKDRKEIREKRNFISKSRL